MKLTEINPTRIACLALTIYGIMTGKIDAFIGTIALLYFIDFSISLK